MASPSNPLPASIGRFRVDALLGRGGMGEVYKAFDPTLQRTVAVKIVRPDIDKPKYLDRLYREAQACARLHHPHIVTVYEAGEIDGVVYIAAEYLQGEDMAAVLRRGALPFEAKIRILAQILDALQHAHSEDVIHRDIKPGNVLQLPDGSVKLVDFGLARMVQADTVTATTAVMCTPHYASPEQLKGGPVDSRTDIYSTGVFAYEMLSGRRPFDGDNVATIVLKVISEPTPPMDNSWSRRFPEIERIVSRAMVKSPAERYQTAEEMRNAVTAFLAASRDEIARAQAEAASDPARPPAPPVPVAPRWPARVWWWLGGAAAAVAIAAAMIAPPAAPITDAHVPGVDPAVKQSARAPDDLPAAARRGSGPSVPANPQTPAPGPGTSAGNSAADPGVKPEAARGDAASVTASAALDLSAKRLFYGDGKATATPPGLSAQGSSNMSATNAGLRYRLIQNSANDTEIEVDPTTTFKSGDRVRFAFESNIDGYLYVAQQGSSGRWTLLFPNPEINGGKNTISRSGQYHVPSDGWWLFDSTPGTEQLFVFLSKEPLNQLPGFDQPVTKTETLTASVVEELQRAIRSRDLVFEKERSASGVKASQATYVVNRAEVGKAVAALISLNHVQ